MKKMKILPALLLPVIILLNITGCAAPPVAPDFTPPDAVNLIGPTPNIVIDNIEPAFITAVNLMENLSAGSVSGKFADSGFINNMADFAVKLFQESANDKENALVSPLSVMLALSMTANGADNETLAQMEKALFGDIPLAELNEYLYNYVKRLPSGEKAKLNIANSIWFRDNEDRLQVKPEFLQANADYYNAAAYKSAFDAETVNSINDWVNIHTDGMIERILDEIDDEIVLFLINAIAFDAEWQTVYNKENIREDYFTAFNGDKQNAEFMHSEEYKYLSDGKATGFIKPYANDQYSFAALLPNEDVTIAEYIETLTGTGLADMIKNAETTEVYAAMPKFSYEYKIQLNDVLKTLGVTNAFDESKADFTKMATSGRGNIFISEVLHKTFISVDELGTRAGAVTMVAMAGRGAPLEPKVVRLDRPFVYAVIDNATGLPIFIGTVLTL